MHKGQGTLLLYGEAQRPDILQIVQPQLTILILALV